MRVAILYASVLAGSFVYWVGMQYGWQPPFAVVWDALARVVVGLVLFLSAVGAGWGLTAGIVIRGLPMRLRLLPAIATNTVISFLFLGIAELSPALTPSEIGLTIGKWAGVGLLVGLLLGVVSNANAAPGDPPAERDGRIGTVFAVLVAAGTAFLLFPRERVNPEVTIEGQHRNAESAFEVGRTSLLGERWALVRITVGDETNLLILEPTQWRSFTNLIATAEGSQSTDWRDVGLVAETGTPDRSQLEVSAGNGVRFVITSAHGPTVSYELPSSEFEELNATAARVTRAMVR